jgi:hypothetical protein
MSAANIVVGLLVLGWAGRDGELRPAHPRHQPRRHADGAEHGGRRRPGRRPRPHGPASLLLYFGIVIFAQRMVVAGRARARGLVPPAAAGARR